MKIWIIYTYNGGIVAVERSRKKAAKMANLLSKLEVGGFMYDIKVACVDLNDYIDVSGSSISAAFWFVNGKRHDRA